MSIARWGLVAVLIILPVGPVGIAAARQQTTDTSQQDDSLAAAARRAREQKKQQSKAPKVWSNDDIPKNADALSVVGQVPPPDDKTANPSSNAASAAKPDAKKLDADLAAAKDQLLTLQNDLDILQRKFTLDQQSFLGKPGYSLDNSGAANLKDEQDQIDAKQQEISDQQKKIEDLQTKPDAANRANQDSGSAANQSPATSSTQTPANNTTQDSSSSASQPKSPN